MENYFLASIEVQGVDNDLENSIVNRMATNVFQKKEEIYRENAMLNLNLVEDLNIQVAKKDVSKVRNEVVDLLIDFNDFKVFKENQKIHS